MSSVLRSTKQPRTKYLIALATSITTAFTIANEDTAPVASGATITTAIGNAFLDMGKIVVDASGDVYRKIQKVTEVTKASPATAYFIKESDLDGSFGTQPLFARL